MAKPTLALIPAAQGSKLYSVLPANGVGDFDFSRNTTATRINKDGLIETVASGVSRLNYPLIDGVVNGCPSLLLEPSRTNLVFYSEDFSNASWYRLNATVISNNVISPDGTLNASSVAFTAGGYLLESVTTTKTIGSSETISVFSKTDVSGTFLKYSGGTASGTDVENKESFGNGWFRYSVTRTFTEAETGVTEIIISSNNVGLSAVIFGAQLEVGSYPTSYIPTEGSAISRTAETANNAGDASTFNDSEGVLMAEISGLTEVGTNQSIAISNGSQSNRILFRYNSTNQVRVIVVSSNAFVFDKTLNISSIKEYNKFVIKYKQNDFALWVNGFELKIGDSGVTPTGLNELALDDGSGANDFYGNTKQIQYFDSALNDSDLETLTSWTSFTDLANGQLYSIK